MRDQYPCFVVAPQCPPEQTWSAVKGWTGPNAFEEEPTAPMKLLLGALDGLLKEFSVDQDRLYVTGLSMGGYGTWDLLTRQPQRWAAAAPICGGGDASRIAPAKGVALWAFHGVLDPTVPVVRTQEMIAALEAAGGKPLYSEYPYVKHDSWNIAYGEPELLPWMFAQKRGGRRRLGPGGGCAFATALQSLPRRRADAVGPVVSQTVEGAARAMGESEDDGSERGGLFR
ncbi:MAG: prolyl oligopeptidase family serine peptidase [Chthoniobacter sp.]